MKPAHRYATATAFRIALEARLKSLAQAEAIDPSGAESGKASQHKERNEVRAGGLEQLVHVLGLEFFCFGTIRLREEDRDGMSKD